MTAPLQLPKGIRRSTRDLQLRPGMIIRKRRSGTYFYLSVTTEEKGVTRRKEIALGADLEKALSRYEEMQICGSVFRKYP